MTVITILKKSFTRKEVRKLKKIAEKIRASAAPKIIPDAMDKVENSEKAGAYDSFSTITSINHARLTEV